MMLMDKTSEKLRSKHVRTLELLQKTLDENVELRDQIGRLKKGTLHLGQGPATPRSNRAAVLEDEIDRLKAEQCAKLLEAEEVSKARHAELAQSVELLQKKALKLQNQVVTLETALFHAKESLTAERTEWESERRLAGQQIEIKALSQQAVSARDREEALAQELAGFRERKSESQRKLNQLQLQSATLLQQQQRDTELASRLSRAEATNEALCRENRSLADQLGRLHAQLAECSRGANPNPTASTNGGVFAVHVELKRENQQLKAQVEELKQLQRRFLTTAKKTTMSFPAI
ncbi:hypothetical protein PybrP1_006984 [[Pythium] brassicae (nom. inval.)]|nr:hypothetical protein PybrP1_006984 [[Pythium] brassicae (nom. inval.)]